MLTHAARICQPSPSWRALEGVALFLQSAAHKISQTCSRIPTLTVNPFVAAGLMRAWHALPGGSKSSLGHASCILLKYLATRLYSWVILSVLALPHYLLPSYDRASSV